MVRRRSKFGNIKTTVDGFRFDSRKEAARYEVLRDLAIVGVITNLRRQVSYALIVDGQKICKYIADFVYEENGQEIVEDVKGRLTDVYKLKAKLMRACLGIVVKET